MSTSTKSCRTTNTDMADIHHRRAVMHGTNPNRVVILSASDKDARRTSTEDTCNPVCLRGDVGIIAFPQLPARPAKSPCQADVSLVPYLPGTSLAASWASRSPHSALKKCSKIAQFLCNLSSLESTLLQVFIPNNLNPFRVNTYENTGGWGGIPVWPPRIHFRVTQERFLRSRDAF
jgi:hypothetical protein